jgi:outer membrane protein assembly factor BamB
MDTGLRGFGKEVTEPGDDPMDPLDEDVDTKDEICNGIDDNNDGQIDEGFRDVDGDGTKDCVDTSCEINDPDSVADILDVCPPVAPIDPWSTTEEWYWDKGLIAASPVVGDLDGDGNAEVVFVDAPSIYQPGDLVALDGRTGKELWRQVGVADAGSGVTIGDVDGDGQAEIFALRGSLWMQTAVAFDSDGKELWEGTSMYTIDAAGIALADMDDDGDIEVVVGLQIIDAISGKKQADIADPGYYVEYPMPYVTDMDGDGTKEILQNGYVFDHKGQVEITCLEGGGAVAGAPIQADSDPEAEMVFSGQGETIVCDDDGSEIWYRERGYMDGWMGAPIVADFDGDGDQEIAYPDYHAFTVAEADGTTIWEQPTNDGSGMSGALAWDMDMDGIDEILYADQVNFYVYDGKTGAIRMTLGHVSSTMMENPVVADIDGDGHGEILRVEVNGATGSKLSALGAKHDDWPYAPPVFNQFGYHFENINADLSIPTNPTTPWTAEGALTHGQPSAIRLPEAQLANLAVDVTDACIASCMTDGYVAAAIQVWNNGAHPVAEGTPVEIWGSNGSDGTLIATLYTTTVMEPGDSESFRIETTSQVANAEIWAQIDPDDGIEECEEDDNQGSFSLAGCE